MTGHVRKNTTSSSTPVAHSEQDCRTSDDATKCTEEHDISVACAIDNEWNDSNDSDDGDRNDASGLRFEKKALIKTSRVSDLSALFSRSQKFSAQTTFESVEQNPLKSIPTTFGLCAARDTRKAMLKEKMTDFVQENLLRKLYANRMTTHMKLETDMSNSSFDEFYYD